MKIIPPHRVNSIDCQEKNIERILNDGVEMVKLCFEKIGKYSGGLAVAHCQITEKEPLRFFATRGGEIIINPVITRHTNIKKPHREGCLSYADRQETYPNRWDKCEVEYFIINNEKEFIKVEEKLTGIRAKVFQHEIDHFNSIYIYD